MYGDSEFEMAQQYELTEDTEEVQWMRANAPAAVRDLPVKELLENMQDAWTRHQSEMLLRKLNGG